MIGLKQRSAVLFLITLLLAGVVLGAALTYRMQSGTVAGGGGAVSGGSYRAETIIGQPTSGVTMEGGPYRVASGFWIVARDHTTVVYLPTIVR